MMRFLVGVLFISIFRLFIKSRNSQKEREELTPQKADFIEKKVEEMYGYVLQSYDHGKAEGKNVLQWLFASVIGGLGLSGTLVQHGYLSVAGGAFFASLWAAWGACQLIGCLRSQDIVPPGNEAASLNTLLDEPIFRMRWRECIGLDCRNKVNLEHVKNVCTGVDRARRSISFIPLWFIGGAIGTSFTRAALSHFQEIAPIVELIRKLPL